MLTIFVALSVALVMLGDLEWYESLVILASAALLLLGQRMTFRALRLAPVGAVAPFHYTELIWAALFGWLFWREWPAAHVWWGAALVVGAGLYAIWHERRGARPA
jgi:drug/metabolite transporter (DMT)-like permease